MAQSIRVGIIGAGWPGAKHAEGYGAAGGFQVAAMADLIPSRRKALIQQSPGAIEYADAVEDTAFALALREKALAWYSNDRDAQAWEPSGDDFLSPTLMEAECMRQVISAADFAVWLDRFLPKMMVKEPATLFEPATVSDRTDGKIAHLDGLNLSRAWCWRSIGATIPASDPRRQVGIVAIRHVDFVHVLAEGRLVLGEAAGLHEGIGGRALKVDRDEAAAVGCRSCHGFNPLRQGCL